MNRAGSLCFVVLVACGATLASRADATPRPLPFTYTTETLGQGELEFEQYVDLTPVKAFDAQANATWYVGSQFQTEFEYGITDRLELGLYVVYVPVPGEYTFTAPMTETTGAKERLRYVFADPGAWPIDVGVYGEIVEGQTEEELELKVLLQRRIGHLRLDANLWGEIEYELRHDSNVDFVANPTAGATYEITPAVHLGVEGWARVEFPNPAPNPRPYGLAAGYVGPALLLNFGKLWWSTGIYGRITDVDHTMQPGEPYGPVWARLVLGFEI
jgi:hypothetical protein